MKVTGIIFSVDTEGNPEATKIIKQMFPNVLFDQGEIDNWEDWGNVYTDRETKLDNLTNKYMCGQDDGKWFYFSDDEEAVGHIQASSLVGRRRISRDFRRPHYNNSQ